MKNVFSRRRPKRAQTSPHRHGISPARRGAALVAVTALLATSVVAGNTWMSAEPAEARYAEDGNGLHTGAIDWFEWGTHGQTIPAGGLTERNTRTVAGQELATTCTLSGITGQVEAYRPGTWSNDALDDLYNIGGTGDQNQLIAGLSNAVNGTTVSFQLDCAVTLDGVTVPLEGLVIADAEASGSGQNEYVQARPAQTATWRIIDRFRGQNCTTSTQAILSADGTMRLAPDGSECAGGGPMAVAFMQGATSAAVELKGGGKSAVAVGVVLQSDFGDAPLSYGEAGALISPQWTGGTVAVGTTPVSGDGFVLGAVGQPSLRLGATVDAESDYQASADASADTGDDAVGPLGTVTAVPGQTYTLEDIECAGDGYVSGWIDWNNNGAFDGGEQSDVATCAGGSVDLTWTVPADVTATSTGASSFLRLRIGADAAAVASPTGLSTSGEVEDHALTLAVPGPFECTSNAAGLLFQSAGTTTTQIQSIDLVTGSYTSATVNGPLGDYNINGVGFNVVDGFVYGYEYNTGELVRVGADGAVQTLGRPTYLPAGQVFNTGDVDENGHLWITQQGPTQPWFQIDLTPGAGFLSLINSGSQSIPAGIGAGPDWAYVPGGGNNLYRVMTNGSSEAVLLAFNRATGGSTVVGSLGDLGGGNVFGAVYADAAGYLYASNNNTGLIHRIDVQAVEAVPFAQGPASSGNDGARCTASAILTDFGDAPASYGTTLSADGPRHGIPGFDTATNTAPLMLGASIDPEVDGQPGAAADGDDTAGVADEDGVVTPIVVTVGDTTTVSVSTTNNTGSPATLAGWIDLDTNGTFDDGERVLVTVPANSGTTTQTLVFPAGGSTADTYARFRIFGGEVADPSPTGPASAGEVEDYTVTVIERDLAITKTSDATADTRVGDTVTFTVTATNTGTADYTAADPVVVLDDLAGVLDDAVYNADAEASLTGDLSFESPLLGWTGALPAGDTVEITYSVTLTVGGDGVVRNVAFAPEDPEDPVTPECNPPVDGVDPVTGEPCAEVELLLPRPTIEKSADRDELPAVGEVVTYTITVTNIGPGDYTAAAPASFVDDLSDVLDDADYVVDSLTVTTGAGTIDGDQLTWSGALAAEESVTVTYSMTYTGAGNQVLLNTACVPVAEGAPGLAACDIAEVPGSGLVQMKTVASSDTPAVAGSVLTYTLHFFNNGRAAATVDSVDFLAHVLDDADVTSEPVASAGLTAVRDGDEIAITGSVPAGETASVTYQVTIGADGERGDDVAANFLLPNDPENPPAPPTSPVCEPVEGELPNCTTTPIAAVEYAKSVAPVGAIGAGTVLNYTVTVTSTGTATAPVSREDVLTDVLDDATLLNAPSSDTATVTVSDVVDGRFLISGELAPGEVARITYSVTINDEADRGNNSANNFLVPPGEEPPAECVEGSAECTTTGLPNITITKAADPVSGSTVVAGQEITYTLTFTNTGEGPGFALQTDLWEGVLDDADLTGDPVVSDPDFTAQAVEQDGESLLLAGGVVEAGQTITVTYTVTVRPDGERGDNVLTNFLVQTYEEPPTECLPDNPKCTTHSVPQLSSWKTVEADTDPVAAGSVLTYTLSFENTGAAAGEVDEIDFLTHVLDDADVTSEPVASTGLTAVRDGEEISVTGSVEVGATSTVTYQVTVRGDGERGDDVAANFLLPNDPDNPPVPPTSPVCEPAEGELPNCTTTPIAAVTYAKSVSASTTPVVAGTVLTYTVTVTSTGQATTPVAREDVLADVLDDATLLTAPASDTASVTVSEVADGRFLIGGELAAGQVATITYQVTVNDESARGNNTADNFLVPPGEDPSDVCEPVEGDLPNCTSTPLPNVATAKSVDPASGSTVVAGQEVTYTLTFTNSGEAAGPVDHTDLLAGVLDDAELTTAPAASDDALAVALEGDVLGITGTLTAGQTVTVSYTVTVLPDFQRGDNVLGNVLVENGEVPSDECLADDPNCTTNPVPEVGYAKSVSASTDPVVAGTVLTYTVSVSNTGRATGVVGREDVLTDVLDDATLVMAPVSDTASVTVSDVVDGRFLIGGELSAGEVAVITYAVSVNDEADRGNNAANNFLVLPGEDPDPNGVCEPAEGELPDCTSTPLPNVASSKSVAPASGTTVVAGQEVTYTLTFTNSGRAAGPVDHTDLLAGVLDDAELTAAPVASDEALTVATGADDSLRITGAVGAGQTITVSYTVTVLPDFQRGDNILGNVLVETGEEPSDECLADDPNCTTNPVPQIDAWKTVVADATPVAEGTVLTYTLFFENSGQAAGQLDMVDDLTHVTDDADVTVEPVSADGLVAERDGNRISVTGAVPAGETYSVTYEVTVRADEERGDDIAANFLLVNDPDNPPTVPEFPVCQPTDGERPDCTVTPIGRLLTGKAVSADSDPVVAGTVLTYTLTFDNQGHAPVVVDHTDILTDVLDDAEWTGVPVVSDEALIAGLTGETLSIQGQLDAGQTVTVTYQVVVNEEADRGNDTADNFLVPTGEEPPAECLAGDPNCTSTPLPNVATAKSADPASGSTVVAGQEVTYTLTFTNSGEAAGPVDHSDLLAGVLDDAALTTAPVASDEALDVTSGADGVIRVTGTLEAGQTVTVSYAVTVLPDGERTDNVLGNVLVETGEEPSGECLADDPNCTTHRVPEIVSSKTVNPASGTPVVAGQELTYTLTFSNIGEAVGAVAKVDDLTHVTDDATVVAEPVASDEALVVSRDGNRISITGDLAPEATVTVTYTVEVNAAGERGDDILGNFLLDPEDETPAEPVCEPVEGELPNCTRNPVSDIVPTKSVNPATGTEVLAGDVLTYTLSFENTGAGVAAVDHTDHMADVLDDADWVAFGDISDGLTIDGPTDGRLHVTGSVEPGETGTVTYQVRVKEYEDQGNAVLANYLTPTEETLSAECLPGNTLCTQNPVTPPAAPTPPPVAPGLPDSGAEGAAATLGAAMLLLAAGTAAVIAIRRGAALAGGGARRRA